LVEILLEMREFEADNNYHFAKGDPRSVGIMGFK
jgi:hypothetical protein